LRTEIIEISPDDPSPDSLRQAADAVRAGRIVAVPTDTLYVLVADPLNLNAIASVFRAKGRELHRALPLLVDSITMAEEYAKPPLSPRFFLLARRFWPGPLTVIVPAANLLPLKVTGNTGRLALRQSAATVPQKLLELIGRPVIATSANQSGQPACRSGIEVFGTMDGRVDLILDAGATAASAATTVDVTEPEWRLIREGAIPRQQIEECLEP